MNLFLLNLLLALLWSAVNGELNPGVFTAGFVLGYLVLWAVRPVLGPSVYYTGLWRLAGFCIFYLAELVLSSLRVARDVLSPRLTMQPGIVALPLEAESDLEITVLANLISLTPGSLSLDVSEDRRTLYVHVMNIEDGNIDALRRELGYDFERRVLRLMRTELD